ncbi:MAG: DUF3455 domain-containing protein [Caulobacteraceae bacterium]
MIAALIAALAAAAPVAPAELAVPAGSALALRAEGRGVQIYVCEQHADQPGQYGWRFVAPQATLLDADGKAIGRHYAGPTWQGADGGKVVGEMRAKMASPDASAIDWLLLSAKSATGGPSVIGRASYVQRLATVGGQSPASGCTGDNLGDQIRVPYSAEYDFYIPAEK